MRTQRKRDERPRVPPTRAGRSLALRLDIAPGGVNFAKVDKLERVSTAREARRHRVVVVVLEPDAPLSAALATDLVVVLGHENDRNGPLRLLVTAQCEAGLNRML
jgi:hypothetical protein